MSCVGMTGGGEHENRSAMPCNFSRQRALIAGDCPVRTGKRAVFGKSHRGRDVQMGSWSVLLDHDDFGLVQSKIMNSDLVLTFRAG